MDKLYAFPGMLGNTGNDLIFKTTARHQGGPQITLFYLLLVRGFVSELSSKFQV